MFDRLAEMEQRYEELNGLLSDPEVIADQDRLREYSKAQSSLAEVVEVYRVFKQVQQELEDARSMLADKQEADFRALVEEEVAELEAKQAELQARLKQLLLPKDPDADRNVIVEIRAGTGGEEAALFGASLFRMYSRYAERQGWRVELLADRPTELGGFKEVTFMVHGRGAYSRLQFESGVHRVQRVPTTESSGRIHTSTATVAVLPEAEEVDVDIQPDELRIDVFRSSGPGGQSVNTTDSAVRITHVPTGIVVSCQDEKSQHKNKDKAMRILRARLLDQARQDQAQEISDTRRSQVGSGDRSERIRTYNFPQGRMTDHRVGLTVYRLEALMEGDLDEVIDALRAEDQSQKLQELEAR